MWSGNEKFLTQGWQFRHWHPYHILLSIGWKKYEKIKIELEYCLSNHTAHTFVKNTTHLFFGWFVDLSDKESIFGRQNHISWRWFEFQRAGDIKEVLLFTQPYSLGPWVLVDESKNWRCRFIMFFCVKKSRTCTSHLFMFHDESKLVKICW